MSDSHSFLVENSTFTFRVNADLKAQFSELCKSQRLSPSTALKLFMEDCLANGYVHSNQAAARKRAEPRFDRDKW